MNNNQLMNSLKLFVLVVASLCLFSTASFAQSCSFTGSWDSNYGKIRLSQSGSKVTGTYGNTGHISGTVQGYKLQAFWWKGNYYQPGEDGGQVNFFISSECKKLRGDWRDGDDSTGLEWHYNAWNATKAYTKPHPPSSPPPNTVQRSGGYGLPTYSNKLSGNSYNNSSSGMFCNWTGTWNAANGKMYLEQRGASTVVGSYERKNGRIKGTISGNKMSGTWSQSPSYAPTKDAGQIVLTISPNCSSFTGSWRYGYNQHYNKWNSGWNATKAR